MNRSVKALPRLLLSALVLLMLTVAATACAKEPGSKPSPAALPAEAGQSEAAHTLPEVVVNVQPDLSADKTAEPTAAPSPPSPQAPEPTEPPTADGIELLRAAWLEDEGSSAVFSLTMRIPMSQLYRQYEIELFGGLNRIPTPNDWDAIMTVMPEEVVIETAGNGDEIRTFTGCLFWPKDKKPTVADQVTVIAAGVYNDNGAHVETDASNALTVGLGEHIEK